MKKKYFTPEMDEVEIEDMVLLAGSCEDESPKMGDDACPGEDVSDM